MIFEVRPLTHDLARSVVHSLVKMDQSYVDQLGAAFTTFVWGAENFLRDVPMKWQLSHIAGRDQEIQGFIISSSSEPRTCHIHRLVVSPLVQAHGLGKHLLHRTIEACAAHKIYRITVECSAMNLGAKGFYEKNGFLQLRGSQIGAYLDERGRIADHDDEKLIEADGSMYVAFERSV